MSITVQHSDHVAVITFNRPESMNAINPETSAALEKALDDIEQDDDIRVVVLTGAGDRAFSAGADLKVFGANGAHRHAPGWVCRYCQARVSQTAYRRGQWLCLGGRFRNRSFLRSCGGGGARSVRPARGQARPVCGRRWHHSPAEAHFASCCNGTDTDGRRH